MSGYPPHFPPQSHAWHGTPQPQPASLSWPQIIGLSTWLVFPLLGCGCLGGAAMIFIGGYARRPAWWISGIGYTTVAAVSFVVTGSSDQDSVVSNAAVSIFLLSWFACVIHAVVINYLWVRLMAARRAESAYPEAHYYPGPVAADPWSGSPYSPATPPYSSAEPQDYYGPGPGATPVSAEPLSEYTIETPAPPLPAPHPQFPAGGGPDAAR